ncbi:hypothetical protein SAMN05443252_11411 [Bacillus sp. OV322]|uniref:GNAT family N-acetyltransferase n=1 Tax=Bacillus sp. OV322 TaxID=1882764 RepID=UPI0008F2FB82|nr:GNAT family N-acetyltransferase [Bacillus sp. OV322]SFD02215.1 hypothetical protein SAMN05443252_11411 [Bacillus sp. OV322]
MCKKNITKLILFEEKDFEDLYQFIESELKGKIIVDFRGSSEYISLDNNNFVINLRTNNFAVQTLGVATISVNPSKKGYGTYILKWLVNYAEKKGFTKILLENCFNDCSKGLAVKTGFTKPFNLMIEYGNMQEKYFGDYEYYLKRIAVEIIGNQLIENE